MSNVKNYSIQGGEKWVVEGELELTGGGRLLFNGGELKPVAGPEDSEAGTIAELKTNFNALLEKLYGAGIVAADKSALEEAILSALGLLDGAAVGEELGQYPEVAYNAFLAAIETAQGVADGKGITQSQANTATEVLQVATATFEEAVIVSAG
ncbi:MAG: hypothetical protein ACOYEQ_08570 [Bacillota bacterium]|jgi:hypothetical protein